MMMMVMMMMVMMCGNKKKKPSVGSNWLRRPGTRRIAAISHEMNPEQRVRQRARGSIFSQSNFCHGRRNRIRSRVPIQRTGGGGRGGEGEKKKAARSLVWGVNVEHPRLFHQSASSPPLRLHLRSVCKMRMNHQGRVAVRAPTCESPPARVMPCAPGRVWPETVPSPNSFRIPPHTTTTTPHQKKREKSNLGTKKNKKVQIGQVKSISLFHTVVKWKQ